MLEKNLKEMSISCSMPIPTESAMKYAEGVLKCLIHRFVRSRTRTIEYWIKYYEDFGRAVGTVTGLTEREANRIARYTRSKELLWTVCNIK